MTNNRRKITVTEDLGYGCFKTDIGTVTIDFAEDGIHQVLISDDGTFSIVDDERDENEQVLSFYVL